MRTYKEIKSRQQSELRAALKGNYISEANGFMRIPDGYVRIVGLGLVKADVAPTVMSMIARFRDELREAIAADTTGKDFILPMYLYEYETQKYDPNPNRYLFGLGFGFSEIWSNPIIKNCLLKAQELYWNQSSVLS